ncbi:MAG: hypothetical protein M1820_004354 [Bogoriella megaspora]|nr:MAG: hypothetical protein M1820_004354 [Bogoriella megaspora]
MPFHVEDVVSDEDFEELLEVEIAAFEQPLSPIRLIYYPVFGEGPEARSASIRECAQRAIARNRATPGSQWSKIIDDDTGKIVAASVWQFYDKDPYTGTQDPEVSWWPRGDGKRFAQQFANALRRARVRYMAKPHAYLLHLTVLPEFRSRGLGRLLLGWGIQKVDERGMEAYIDAAAMSKPLYERCGFVAGDHECIDFDGEGDKEWHELVRTCLPFEYWPMWRPAKGDYGDAKVFRPVKSR